MPTPKKRRTRDDKSHDPVRILAIQAVMRRGTTTGALRETLDALGRELAKESPFAAAAMEALR